MSANQLAGSEVSSAGDLLDRAFRLAFFLHRDKALAMQLTLEAVTRSEVAAAAQDKRRYYTPHGRPRLGQPTGLRNKVSLSQAHLLQRLVYSVSETYEKRQEQTADQLSLSLEDMIVRYVEHLVKITLRRNSFYVTVALSRLLYSYSTEEAMAIYELLVQDPKRFKNIAYYRSRKCQLLKEIRHRFGSRIHLSRGRRGETRVESQTDSRRFGRLVVECLSRFTPWGTPCVVPERFDPDADTLAELQFTGEHPDDEHPIEMNRLHTLLHPRCFSRLTRSLDLEAPDRRLRVPHFTQAVAEGLHSLPPRDRFRPPILSDRDRRTLTIELAERLEHNAVRDGPTVSISEFGK